MRNKNKNFIWFVVTGIALAAFFLYKKFFAKKNTSESTNNTTKSASVIVHDLENMTEDEFYSQPYILTPNFNPEISNQRFETGGTKASNSVDSQIRDLITNNTGGIGDNILPDIIIPKQPKN